MSKTNQTAREVALETLIRVFNQNGYSNLSLNNQFKQNDLSHVDEQLATNLVYGTIQWKLYLEYQIKDLYKDNKKYQWIKPLLLMSVYQLKFLDKVPSHAILNEANLIAKKYSKGNLYKLVNGVLRSYLRRGEVLPSTENEQALISVKYSTPEWLVEYLVSHFGTDRAAEVLASINQAPHLAVRITELDKKAAITAALDKEGISFRESELNINSLIIESSNLFDSELFKSGLLTVQDEAAALVTPALQVKGQDEVLDACSAPGGKTVQIAHDLVSGEVVALDIHQKKLNLVMQNAERMNVANRVVTRAADARKISDFYPEAKFDKILVDAPCSGLGLMRRKPEIKYTKTMKDIQSLAKIQYDILDNVAKVLNDNGRLVYSTCTISVEENEEVIEKFLQNHSEFSLEQVHLEKENTQIRSGKFIRIFPDTYGSDGFFIASLVKNKE